MTHYEVLGVPRDAALEEIKRAYYERARRYHPDAHAASSVAIRAEAERTMQALNSSWTVLRDPQRRRRYDRALARATAEAPDAGSAPGRRSGVRVRSDGTATATATATAASSGRTAARTTRTPGRGVAEVRGRVALAPGFQHWFGAVPAARIASTIGGGSARRGLNLRLTGTSLAPLRALAPDGLVGLHAAQSAVDDVELRNLLGLRSLRFLDLAGTRVSDAGLVHLLGCEQLEVLSLWDTAITDDGLALLGRLPNLRHLGLGNTKVTDRGLRHLAGLRRLRLVQLAGTAVTGPGLRHLHGLPELTTVSLPWKVGAGHRRRLRAALPSAALA